jgi:RsiW-degrading membrane proteinase PrsW (M82 family)
MFCTACGRQLAEGTRFCPACGTATAPSSGSFAAPGPSTSPANQPLTAVTDFLQEVASVSLKEITLVDGERAAEILKSPVFLLLSLVAIVPLAIQSLESAHSILYGLAIWSGLLWALLMYRLFADRQVSIFWSLATVFFTAFIGIPLLGLYLQLPGKVFERVEAIDFFPLTLVANVLGVGVREELTKAIPLFLVAYFTTRMRNPVMGMVLGMMSGIGFAITENVFYVFTNLSQALGAVRTTGKVSHLVGPIYTNVVRMAMTPFFHGCLAGIFGYFIALATLDPARRWPLLVAGLAISATLHGLFDALVPRSPMWGVLVEGMTFFLMLTYVLKARGLASAEALTRGLLEPPPVPTDERPSAG